jgi:hypothetical protein
MKDPASPIRSDDAPTPTFRCRADRAGAEQRLTATTPEDDDPDDDRRDDPADDTDVYG